MAKERLLKRAEELKAKINMFITQGGGAERYNSIIAKFQAELAQVENQLSLLESTTSTKPKEEKVLDPVLTKLYAEAEGMIERVNYLKSIDCTSEGTMKMLQRTLDKIEGRELLASKLDGYDIEGNRPASVTKFIKTAKALKKELEKAELEKKKSEVSIGELEAMLLNKASVDATADVLSALDSGEAE